LEEGANKGRKRKRTGRDCSLHREVEKRETLGRIQTSSADYRALSYSLERELPSVKKKRRQQGKQKGCAGGRKN